MHGLTEIVESIRHGFQLVTIIEDREITLHEVADIEPREDKALHAHPRRDVEVRSVGEHVIRQGILAQDDEEEAAPLGKVRRGKVKNDKNKRPNVEDVVRLHVEGGDHSSVGEGQGASCLLIMERDTSSSRRSAW
uniref:Uncharacterized protein n=1 Tax=Kalanchoe fedtschenkoi TaxID=63787 RepID=A0A7N0TX93_KALFE